MAPVLPVLPQYGPSAPSMVPIWPQCSQYGPNMAPPTPSWPQSGPSSPSMVPIWPQCSQYDPNMAPAPPSWPQYGPSSYLPMAPAVPAGVGDHLLVTQCPIGLLPAPRQHLPQRHPKSPRVAGGGEGALWGKGGVGRTSKIPFSPPTAPQLSPHPTAHPTTPLTLPEPH